MTNHKGLMFFLMSLVGALVLLILIPTYLTVAITNTEQALLAKLEGFGYTAYADPSGNLVPAANNTYDLGTNALKWRTGYLGTDLNVTGDVTVGGTLDFLSPTQGDILVADASADWSALAVGAANEWLNTDGTDPSWRVIPHINAATLVVCASDALNTDPERCDYVAPAGDARATIEAADNALAATGGGEIALSEGTFLVASATAGTQGITIDTPYATLRGTGGGTIIKLADGFNANISIVYLEGPGNIVKDLTIDGNQAGNTVATQTGIRFASCNYCVVENTYIHDTHYYAVYADNSDFSRVLNNSFTGPGTLLGLGGGVWLNETSDNNAIVGNTIQSSAHNSITLAGSKNVAVGNQLIGCGTAGSECIDFIEGSSNLASGNFMTGALGEAAVKLGESTEYPSVVGNYITNSAQAAIQVIGTQNGLISGNYLINSSQTANNTYDAIQILEDVNTRNALYNRIANNYILDVAANKARYGVNEVDADQNYNIVENNHFSGQATAAVRLQGANSRAALNTGSPNSTFGEGASFTHTFDAGAVDPVWTYSSGFAQLSTGTLRVDGAIIGGGLTAVPSEGTKGLFYTQGASDNDMLELSSTDVTHAMTQIVGTNVYFKIAKDVAGQGSPALWGFGDGDTNYKALVLRGSTTGSGDSTKTTTTTAPVYLDSGKFAAANKTALGADKAVAVIGNDGSVVWGVDADGDAWQTGAQIVGSSGITLGNGVTTFAVSKGMHTITGDGGGNTVATITAGVGGQVLYLKFVDSLVTITDTDAATANTVNLSAAFTSTANDTLTLLNDGTKWLELARAVN